MAWQRVGFVVERKRAEAASEYLDACAAHAVSLLDAGDEALFDLAGSEHALWARVRVEALFDPPVDAPALLAKLRRVLADPGVELAGVERVEDRDWVGTVREQFQPVHVAPGLWICPSWATPPQPREINIRLDPGLAFGTGGHPTTRLCLAWMARNPPRGQAVIDYGTGSGVLGIAAIRLGASRVTGIDIDPHAIRAARENARANGVAERFEARGPEPVPAPADLVVANILAGALIDLAPLLGSLLRLEGTLLLSGILEPQADEVCRAYNGRLRFSRETSDGWVLLCGRGSA